MLTFDEACQYLWREEGTDWGKHDYVPNHIYITKGATLAGYVPRGTKDIIMYETPLKTWSVSRRKFRKLNRKEIRTYFENK